MTRDYFTSIPIWVKLQDLSLDLWTKEAFRHTTSTLGKPIRMDNNTAKDLHLHFAQVLIEIQSDYEHPTHVQGMHSNGTIIDIEVSYKYMPKPCDNCHVFGHSTMNCSVS